MQGIDNVESDYNDDNGYKLEDLKYLKYLIDNIPYAVWIKGSDGIYKYVNKHYAGVTALTPKDIIGKYDYEFRDEVVSKLFLAEDKEILEDEKIVFHRKTPVNMEFQNFFEVSRLLLKSNDSDIKLIGGIGRDITLNENIYKQIEESTLNLLENNRKRNNKNELAYILKNSFKACGITIYIYDEEDRKMNIFLKTYDDIIIPKDHSFYLNEIDEQSLINHRYLNENDEINYNKKELRYVKTYSIKFESELIGILNIHYADRNSYSYIQEDLAINTCDRLGVIIKNRILTNKHSSELKKRRETEKKLQIFLETTIDFYIILDENQNYLEINRSEERWKEFFGYTLEEIKYRLKKGTLRHMDDNIKMNSTFNNAKKVNKLNGVIIRYLCNNNEYKTISWNLKYVSEYKRFFLTGKDITSELKLEKEKKELKKTIELESLKTDFFANMSHEFKTPLNIILTAVQVLLEKSKNEENKLDLNMNKYLNGIKQNSYRLLKLVNNIMDITKIDSGSYSLELGNHNIVSVVEDIVLSVAEYISENKRNIIFDTIEEEIILSCDPMKIERIMLNLLSNALKYTYEGGSIEINIEVNHEKNEVIISVRNDGDAISDEDKERIFDRFTQSENLFTRKAEGTGIGLFLVKSLVELHNGRVYVDTSVSEGSKFVVIIPILLTKEKEEQYTYRKQISSKIERCNIEFSDIYSI